MFFVQDLFFKQGLVSFDEFQDLELFTERDLQDYLGRYQDLRDEWNRKRKSGESVEITDDIVFVAEQSARLRLTLTTFSCW